MLERAPKEVVPGALLSGLRAGGQVIEEHMAGRVPDKTGDLLSDLGTTITLDSDFRGGIAQVGFTSAQAHKAGWVEYGHRMVSHEPDKAEIGQVQPHPFMRPAADASAEEAVEAFTETVMAELEKGQILDAA